MLLFVFLWLACFTWHNVLKDNSCFSRCQLCFLFESCTMLCHIYRPDFAYPFIHFKVMCCFLVLAVVNNTPVTMASWSLFLMLRCSECIGGEVYFGSHFRSFSPHLSRLNIKQHGRKRLVRGNCSHQGSQKPEEKAASLSLLYLLYLVNVLYWNA